MAGPLVDVGERGLSQTRRPVEEQMVEGLAALPGCANEDREVLAQAVLTHHLVESAGPETLVDARLVGQRRPVEFGTGLGNLVHRRSLFREARTRTSSVASEPASSAASTSTRSASVRG